MKPRLGQPCNGCGVCCVAEPCAIALMIEPALPLNSPCPFLERRGEGFGCELAAASNMIAMALGVGVGCDAGPEEDDDGPDDMEGLNAAGYLVLYGEAEALLRLPK